MSFDAADPKWTRLALGELDAQERSALEEQLQRDPHAMRNLEEIQRMAGLAQEALQDLSALELTPEQRQAIRQRLEEPEPLPATTEQTTRFRRLVVARFGLRSKGTRIAAGLVFVTLSTGVVSLLVMRNRPSPQVATHEPRVPPLALDSAEQQAVQTRFSVATPEMPSAFHVSISPDGGRIAFVARTSPSTTTTALFVRPVDSIDAQPLVGTEGASFPFWSPDSRLIGFAAQGKLKRIDLSGGPPLILSDLPNFTGATWNADGVIVFSGGPAAPLSRVAAWGGKPAVITALDEKQAETAHAWPVFLPDGRHFLFTAWSSRPENRAIYVGSLDSTERTQVLRAASMPLYAPPGYLLFHRDGTLLAQPFDADRLALRGAPIRVTDGVAFDPANGRAAVAVSNTGTLVYGSGNTRITVVLNWTAGRVPPLASDSALRPGSAAVFGEVNLATVKERPLVLVGRDGSLIRELGRPALYYDYRIAPDGRLLAVDWRVVRPDSTGLREVWLLDLERQTLSRLTFAGGSAPVWTPDGARIAYTEASANALYFMDSKGRGGKQLLWSHPSSDVPPFPLDWSPDGRFLLVQVLDSTTGWDMWLLPASGGSPAPYLISRFNEGGARFSPDGRWVAYTSDESGREEIYVRPFPERGGKWQVSPRGGRAPRWRRDGGEIFYIGPNGNVMAVAVQLGAQFLANLPQSLFQNPMAAAGPIEFIAPFEVLPDGQQFILLGRER